MPWRPKKTKSLSDPAPTARHTESATHQIHFNAAPLPLFASDAKPMARWGACLTRVEGCAETGNSRHRRISGYRCRHSVYSNFWALSSSSHVLRLLIFVNCQLKRQIFIKSFVVCHVISPTIHDPNHRRASPSPIHRPWRREQTPDHLQLAIITLRSILS